MMRSILLAVPVLLAGCAQVTPAERADLEQIVRYSAAECAQAGYRPGSVEHTDCTSILAKQYARMLDTPPDYSAALGMMMLGTSMMQQPQLQPPAPRPPVNCWTTGDFTTCR